MITFLSGGTGTPKLIQGFRHILQDSQISIIANSADDIEIYGLYVSPDIDTIIYLFSNHLDTEKYWGVLDDSYNTLEYLKLLGYETWFKIGDKDFATHLFRKEQIMKGKKPSEIIDLICHKLEVKSKIFPSSDTHIETRIKTHKGEDIHFQEFWVREKGEIDIEEIYVENIKNAQTPRSALDVIDENKITIIGPSNPVTSIRPIINIKEIEAKLAKNKEKSIAISPIIGGAPISGPTAKLMKTMNIEVSSVEIAKMYQDICSTFIIDKTERALAPKIVRETGLEVLTEDILFRDSKIAKNLAKKILDREFPNE